jgi:hypothetical protein
VRRRNTVRGPDAAGWRGVAQRTERAESLGYPAGRHRDSGASRNRAMTLHISLAPLLALIAGILILIRPKLLNFIVAIYLIVIGILGLFPGLGSVF